MNRLSIFFVIIFSFVSLFGNAKINVTSEPFDTIRFELGENGKIFVKATINTDTVPLRFLFDTGSVDNILNLNSPRALSTLNTDALDSTNSNTSTSTTDVKVTPYNNAITIGETEFQGVRFLITPCSEDIDGIIGWNTLTGADFLIDYHKQRILLYDIGQCEIDDTSAWLPLTFIDGLPSIDISFDFEGKTYQSKTWLDSGSDRCFDLSTAFIRQHELDGKQKPWGVSQIAGMDGAESRIDEVIAPLFCIGNFQLYQIPMGLNFSNAGAAANIHFDGVIGNNLLQRFNQIWSFDKKRLYLQPNRRMYAAPYKPQEGLLKNRVELNFYKD